MESLRTLTDLANADLAGYKSQFSALEALPFGGTFLRFLMKRYRVTGDLPDGCAGNLHDPGDSGVLLLTERYPNEQNPYRNGFVHRRVKAYEARGTVFPVFCMDMLEPPGRYLFDGVQVTVGCRTMLYRYLCDNPQIRTVCVHFLNPMMWEVLKNFPQIRLIVWMHGYDVLPWHHRPFLYSTKAEQEFGRRESAKREKFWNEIFSLAEDGTLDAEFICVSAYLKGLVESDYRLAGKNLRFSVIPNCVDTGLFTYREKDAAQRYKILSVRPYQSKNYANDLTAAAILELSQDPIFEKLEILIAGDGELFQKTTAPLRRFPNVTLHKGFYTQPQLAELYRAYGINLHPTRFDTQGVSRDEAFSCGMAVITTDCSCVPEFADETCAVLTPPEDARAIAAAVKRLVSDEQEFLRLSAAARRQAERLSPDKTAAKELTRILRQE